MGAPRFSGPGAPSRLPAPTVAPPVSTEMKSLALSSESCSCAVTGPGVVRTSATLVQFPLPGTDPVHPPGSLRTKEWLTSAGAGFEG